MKESKPVDTPITPLSAQKTKQPWRKPTVSFIPLHVTALEVGSDIDGENGELVPRS